MESIRELIEGRRTASITEHESTVLGAKSSLDTEYGTAALKAKSSSGVESTRVLFEGRKVA